MSRGGGVFVGNVGGGGWGKGFGRRDGERELGPSLKGGNKLCVYRWTGLPTISNLWGIKQANLYSLCLCVCVCVCVGAYMYVALSHQYTTRGHGSDTKKGEESRAGVKRKRGEAREALSRLAWLGNASVIPSAVLHSP